MAELISTGLRHTTLPENYIRPISDRPRLTDVSNLENFPLIDLSYTDRSLLIQQLHQACSRNGFFQVLNHGVSEQRIDETASVAHEFFSLSMEEKMKLYSDDPTKTTRLSTSFNVKKEKLQTMEGKENKEGKREKVMKKIRSKVERLLRSRTPIEIFTESGPTNLTSIDWNDMNNRTAVLACLVKAVYILEQERQRGILSDHSESKAKSWWVSLNFSLDKTLADPDGVIYGAVFDYNDYRGTPKLTPRPSQVIAFRGTLFNRGSWFCDLFLDLRCIFGTLNKSYRFIIATEEITKAVEKNSNIADVWVAGHSLGAAMALLIGKNMARSNLPLESHLFNPPFLSIPIEMLVDSKMLKHVARLTGSLIKAGIAKVIKDKKHSQKDQEDEACKRLTSWTPYLYLNKSDWLCSEYIGYFEHRVTMSKVGAETTEKIATKISLMSTLLDIYRKLGGSSSQDSSSEPIHVLPSAYLTINNHKLPGCESGHELRQWWDRKCSGEFVLHQFKF